MSSAPDLGSTELIVAPDAQQTARLIRTDPENSVHIFAGIRDFPFVHQAFLACLPTSARMGIFAEPRPDQGMAGLARRMQRRMESRHCAKRLSFLLSTGQMGVDWFVRCGYPKSLVYNFGYFMVRQNVPPPVASADSTMRLIFVGQLIPRKGVDTLIAALAPLKPLDWHLTVVGKGESQARLLQQANDLGIGSRIDFISALPNQEVIAAISRHDLLILPSRFDGWGGVVNEALMCGVPVICSDRCGAADLVREDWRGNVFPAQNAPALRSLLETWIQRGTTTQTRRDSIRRWSETISGEAAAEYLLRIIETAGKTPQPIPPWLRNTEEVTSG